MANLAPRTLRDFADRSWTLDPSCSNYFACYHMTQLDPEYLASYLGWHFDIYAGRATMLRRLRCKKCGRNWPEIRLGVSAAGMWHGNGGHSLSRSS